MHRVVGVCGKFMVCACHRCYIETDEKNKPYVTRNGRTHVPSEVKSTVAITAYGAVRIATAYY